MLLEKRSEFEPEIQLGTLHGPGSECICVENGFIFLARAPFLLRLIAVQNHASFS